MSDPDYRRCWGALVLLAVFAGLVASIVLIVALPHGPGWSALRFLLVILVIALAVFGCQRLDRALDTHRPQADAAVNDVDQLIERITARLAHGSAASVATGCTCSLCKIARDYLADHAEDVLILCPYCGDWEDLYEIEDQLATGRFWCCWMCDKCPDRAWPRSSS
jgi:hypothetical protein